MQYATIALLDSHVMFRKGLIELIHQFEGYKVSIEAGNEQELTEKIKKQGIPDILLLEILIPSKNGYDIALWMKKHYPSVKVIALSSISSDFAVSKMIINGACGFVTKEAAPAVLKKVLEKVYEPGFVAGGVNGLFVQKMLPDVFKHVRQYMAIPLTEKEISFMQLCGTNLTYQQMADEFSTTEKSVDKIREKLFEKLDVKNRSALAIFAVENGLRQYA